MLHGLDDLTPIQQSGKTIVSGGAAHRFAGGDQFLLHHDQPLANQQTSLEFQFVETLGQEKSSTPASIALSRSARPLFCGKQDRIYVFLPRFVAAELSAQFYPVHSRHDPVDQSQHGRTRTPQNLPRLQPIRRSQDFEAPLS